MKTITTIVAAAIAAMALTTPHQATAQRFGGGFRAAPTVTYRPPAPVYRAPAPAYRPPAPAYVQRAPTVTYRQPAVAAKPAPAVRPPVPAAKPRPPVSLAKAVPAPRATVATIRAPGGPARSSFRYGPRSYAWTNPAVMPIWWMAAMHQPYSMSAYERFIQQCIRTPRDRRSRECVRALRERGITA